MFGLLPCQHTGWRPVHRKCGSKGMILCRQDFFLAPAAGLGISIYIQILPFTGIGVGSLRCTGGIHVLNVCQVPVVPQRIHQLLILHLGAALSLAGQCFPARTGTGGFHRNHIILRPVMPQRRDQFCRCFAAAVPLAVKFSGTWTGAVRLLRHCTLIPVMAKHRNQPYIGDIITAVSCTVQGFPSLGFTGWLFIRCRLIRQLMPQRTDGLTPCFETGCTCINPLTCPVTGGLLRHLACIPGMAELRYPGILLGRTDQTGKVSPPILFTFRLNCDLAVVPCMSCGIDGFFLCSGTSLDRTVISSLSGFRTSGAACDLPGIPCMSRRLYGLGLFTVTSLDRTCILYFSRPCTGRLFQNCTIGDPCMSFCLYDLFFCLTAVLAGKLSLPGSLAGRLCQHLADPVMSRRRYSPLPDLGTFFTGRPLGSLYHTLW